MHPYKFIPTAGSHDYCYATVSEKLEPAHTLKPNISSLESQPQYEVPVPKQRNVNSTLEPSDKMYEMEETKVSEII